MLEKDKNCIEFSMHSMMATHKPYQEDTEIAITGMAPGKSLLLSNNPFDIPCDVVVVSKRYFERLQADNQHYHELAKQREENYNLLLKKTGFNTIESLVFYLTNSGLCGTLLEALAKLRDREKYICSERDSERDRVKTLQEENDQLKKKLAVPDPIPDYKEMLEKLYSKEDVEKFEWTLNHICGGQASVNGWMITAKLWRRNYETLSKLVGFSSTEEIQDYLTNEAECDTLQEAVSKLKDQVKYTCDEWYSANSNNNSWKVAAECNSPKELIEKRETIEKEIQVYSRALQEWKEITGYPSPSAVKTALESGASWCYAYNEIKKANEKLADYVKSWKNVTGYSTPEDYMHARLNNTTPFDYTAAWQKATDCDTPEKAKERIKALNERIDESEADYNHLLCTTGFESESEIEDALDQCGHSTLRKALVDYEFDYEELLKLTGYKSNQDIRVTLNYSEQFVYETMRELINSLKRQAKYTNLNWQNSTGFITPEKCGEYIKKLEDKLHRINGISEEA